MKRAAIIGAGISGLSSAIVLAEKDYETVIFAADLPLETTSAVAGAIWFPYDVAPVELAIPWAFFTYGRLIDLANDPTSGVFLTDFQILSRFENVTVPPWTDVIGYRLLEKKELPPPFLSGYTIKVPKMETPTYLPYLAARFTGPLRGSIQRIDRLARIEELPSDGFDLIVNCSGFGARELVPDAEVLAHAGQVLIVPKSKRVHAMVCADDPLTYVIPRQSDCVLGGMNAREEAHEELPADAPRQIVDRCRVAGFDESCDSANAPIGIRPYRKSGVRLQAERTRENRLLIHNYGHGGCGLTLSWGCAQKVLHLAETFT